MKKFGIFILLSTLLAFGVNSCNSCTKDSEMPTSSEIVVENTISLDKEYMFLNYGEDYRWYETCILLKSYLDEENDGTVMGVSNVFQVATDSETGGMDTHVILIAHSPDSSVVDVKHGFWVEDLPLNADTIKITFKEAFEKLNEVNLPKPHSRQVVLRKELGPINANPQYIFGNTQSQIYVDAITGDVIDYNPVFPKNSQLSTFNW